MEAAAGKGQRCAMCRLTLRKSWPDPNKPKPRPEDLIQARCEFCHSDYTASLANTAVELREAFRLHYSFTLEDQYTNPKAHALQLWLEIRQDGQKRRKHGTNAKAKINNKGTSALAKLREDARNLITQKHKRLQAKYGEQPFPEHMQIIKSVRNREHSKRNAGGYVKGLFDLEQQETAYLICSELEKIIWGNIRPETTLAIEKIGREIDELIITTEEAERRRKEEARLKDLEFLNKNRASVGLPPLSDDYGTKI